MNALLMRKRAGDDGAKITGNSEISPRKKADQQPRALSSQLRPSSQGISFSLLSNVMRLIVQLSLASVATLASHIGKHSWKAMPLSTLKSVPNECCVLATAGRNRPKGCRIRV